MVRSAGRPGVRVKSEPKLAQKYKGVTETTQQAIASQQAQYQGQNVVVADNTLLKTITTPQGAIQVSFNNTNGILTPTGITKNQTFNAPINATSGNLSIVGNETLTYQISGKSLVAVPTATNGTVSYSGTQIGTLTPSGAVQITPGALVSVPQYGQVGSNSNQQYLGSINYTPVATGTAINFNYSSFTPGTVLVNGKIYVPGPNASLNSVGYGYRAITNFNPTTNQIGLTPLNLSGQPIAYSPQNTAQLFQAVGIGNTLIAPTITTITNTVNLSSASTSSTNNFQVTSSQVAALLSNPGIYHGTYLGVTSTGSLTSTPPPPTTQVIQSISLTDSELGSELTSSFISGTSNSFGLTGFSKNFSTTIGTLPVIGSAGQALFNFEQGVGYQIVAFPSSVYFQGKAFALNNPNASASKVAVGVGSYFASSVVSLTPPAIIYNTVQSVRQQGIIKTSESVAAGLITFGAISDVIGAASFQVNPIPKGEAEVGPTSILTNGKLTHEVGVVGLKGVSVDTTDFENPKYVNVEYQEGQIGEINFRGYTNVKYENNIQSHISIKGISTTLTTGLGQGGEHTFLTGGNADVIVRTIGTTPLRDFLNIAPKVSTETFSVPLGRGIVSITTEHPLGLAIQEAPVYPAEAKNTFITGYQSSGETTVLREIGNVPGASVFGGERFSVTGFDKSGELILSKNRVYLFDTDLTNRPQIPYIEKLTPFVGNGKTSVKVIYSRPVQTPRPETNPSSALAISKSEPSLVASSSDAKQIFEPTKPTTLTTSKARTQTVSLNLDQIFQRVIKPKEGANVYKLAGRYAVTTSLFKFANLQQTQIFKTTSLTKSLTQVQTQKTQSLTKQLKQTQTTKTAVKQLKVAQLQKTQVLEKQLQQVQSLKTQQTQKTQELTQKTQQTQKTQTLSKVVAVPTAPSSVVTSIGSLFSAGGRFVKKPKIIQPTKPFTPFKYDYVSDVAHVSLGRFGNQEKNKGRRNKLGKIGFYRPLPR